MRNTEEVLCPFKIKHSHSLHVKRIRFNVFEHHRECGRKFKFANGRYSHKSNPNQLFFWWYNLKFFSFRPIPFVDLFCASFLFPCIFPKPPPSPPLRWPGGVITRIQIHFVIEFFRVAENMTFKHFHDGKTQRRELKKISRPSYFRPTCLWLWFVPLFHMVSVGTVCGCCQQCCRLELVKNWYICNRLVCVLCRKACVNVLSLRMYYTCTPSGCGALIHHEGSAFASVVRFTAHRRGADVEGEAPTGSFSLLISASLSLLLGSLRLTTSPVSLHLLI